MSTTAKKRALVTEDRAILKFVLNSTKLVKQYSSSMFLQQTNTVPVARRACATLAYCIFVNKSRLSKLVEDAERKPVVEIE